MSWGQLLPRLNLPVSALALPAVTVCPMCRAKQLYIMQDPVFAGEWSYCTGCEFHGDMIELAAQAWKLDLAATVERLQQNGFNLPALESKEYLTKVARPRAIIEKFWRDSQALMDQRQPAINALAHDWGCCPHWHYDWKNTGRRIVAATTRERFNEFAGELTVTRLPREKGFHLVLLHPYYDAPGRIAAFHVLGRDATRTINVQNNNRHKHQRATYGFTMLDAALRPAPRQLFGDVVVAEWETAFRLQIQHLRTSSQFLPIMAPFSWDHEQVSLATIGRRRIRVLPDNNRLTPPMTIFAKRHNAGVVTLPWNGISARQTSKNRPIDWLTMAQHGTTGWHSGVLDALVKFSPPEATEFLAQLQLTRQECEELLHRCDGVLRPKLLEALPLVDAPSELLAGSLRIRETAAGWFHRAGSQTAQVTVGIVRCDQVIEGGERTQIVGRVLRDGQEIPFTLAEKVIRRDGLLFALRDELRRRGDDIDFLPRYNQRAWSIATAFHPPKIVPGAVAVGWDAKHNCFRLPGCTIRADGKLEPPAPVLAEAPYPGRDLAAPGALISRYAATLSEPGPSTALAWSLALVSLRSIVSPVLRLPNPGVAMYGPGCETTVPVIAAQLGCVRTALPVWTPTTATYKQFAKLQTRHGWPTLLTVGEGARPTVWIAHDHGNAMLPTSRERALFAAVRGWDVLHAKLATISPELEAGIRHVIPNYLQNLCKRRLPLRSDARLTQELLDDLADWWRDATGKSLNPHLVRRCFPYATRPPAELFRDAVQHVELAVADKQTAVLISQQALTAATKLRNLPPLNYPRITQTLQAAGVLLDVHDSADDHRWAVRPDWWYARCTDATESTVSP